MAIRNTSSAAFDLRFPKTGGGEDIDYCLKVTQAGALGRMVAVPGAAAQHPWWDGGRHSWLLYRRVYRWALGDGQLLEMYPQLTYWAAPSATELGALLLALAAPAALGSALALLLPGSAGPAAAFVLQQAAAWLARAAAAVKLADVVLDVARNCCHPARLRQHPCSSLSLRILASALSCLIKTASEAGRLVCQVQLGRAWALGHRFDWFCGMEAAVVAGERRRALARCCCYAGVAAGMLLAGASGWAVAAGAMAGGVAAVLLLE
jgi:hypothetical protein